MMGATMPATLHQLRASPLSRRPRGLNHVCRCIENATFSLTTTETAKLPQARIFELEAVRSPVGEVKLEVLAWSEYWG